MPRSKRKHAYSKSAKTWKRLKMIGSQKKKPKKKLPQL